MLVETTCAMGCGSHHGRAVLLHDDGAMVVRVTLGVLLHASEQSSRVHHHSIVQNSLSPKNRRLPVVGPSSAQQPPLPSLRMPGVEQSLGLAWSPSTRTGALGSLLCQLHYTLARASQVYLRLRPPSELLCGLPAGRHVPGPPLPSPKTCLWPPWHQRVSRTNTSPAEGLGHGRTSTQVHSLLAPHLPLCSQKFLTSPEPQIALSKPGSPAVGSGVSGACRLCLQGLWPGSPGEG